MSGPILLSLADPSFDLQVALKKTMQQEGDHERPTSPATFDLSDGCSSLSSLPPSPDLSAASLDNNMPPVMFLDSSDASTSVHTRPKMKQVKQSNKITPPNRQARKNASAKTSRQARRSLQNQAPVVARPKARLKHLSKASPIVVNGFDAQALPAAKTGYIGADDGSSYPKSLTLDEAISKHHLRLIKWDGSFSAGVIDQNNRILAILAGHPDDKNWPILTVQAAEALESRRSRLQIPKDKKKHRRGKFSTLNCGVSYGGGQQVPSNLQNDPPNARVVSELNSLPPFKRIAGFASSVMATWAPKLYEYYRTKTELLHLKHPNLTRIFPGSVFSAVSYNFGPRTVCSPHTDPGNVAFGECSVTPFGPYDYKKGGHLVLWNLKLVIEFPPGCTILFPSAVLSHSNVAIAKHEKRYSFAQYTAGGLFRWVDQGFQTKDQHWASLSAAELAQEEERLDGMWKLGLSLIPTVYTSDGEDKE